MQYLFHKFEIIYFVAEAVSFVCCIVSFSHLLCDCVLNGKSVTHSATAKETEGTLY